MREYTYKGFKVSYQIISSEIETNLFKADGTLTCLPSMPKALFLKKFHTEDNSYARVEHEIKKLLENYIDFELKNFYDMQKEKEQAVGTIRHT